MNGPFTTITVIQYQKMQDVIVAADRFSRLYREGMGGLVMQDALDALEKALKTFWGKP